MTGKPEEKRGDGREEKQSRTCSPSSLIKPNFSTVEVEEDHLHRLSSWAEAPPASSCPLSVASTSLGRKPQMPAATPID